MKNILIIKLSRFEFDMTHTIKGLKKETPVIYDDIIDLKKYNIDNISIKYKLIGVIV